MMKKHINVLLFAVIMLMLLVNVSITMEKFDVLNTLPSGLNLDQIISTNSVFWILYILQVLALLPTVLLQALIISLVSGLILKVKLKVVTSMLVVLSSEVFVVFSNMVLLLTFKLDRISISYFVISSLISIFSLILVYMFIIRKQKNEYTNIRLAMSIATLVLIQLVFLIIGFIFMRGV